MADKKREEKYRQLLALRIIKTIQSGDAITAETRGNRMKINYDLLKAIKQPVLTIPQTHRILQYLANQIKARCPVDTGRLKGAIRFKVTAPGKGYIYIEGKRNNEVAIYQHDGTEAHFVAPVRAEALHWVAGGKDYFSKGHMVSGIIGTEFFKPTPQELKHVRDMAYKYYRDNLKMKVAA